MHGWIFTMPCRRSDSVCIRLIEARLVVTPQATACSSQSKVRGKTLPAERNPALHLERFEFAFL